MLCVSLPTVVLSHLVFYETIGLLIISHPDLYHFNTNLLCYHSWQLLCPALLSNPIAILEAE